MHLLPTQVTSSLPVDDFCQNQEGHLPMSHLPQMQESTVLEDLIYSMGEAMITSQ